MAINSAITGIPTVAPVISMYQRTFRGIYNPNNESELVLGYFGASAVTDMYYKIEPNDVGAPRPFCRWNSTDDACNNCLLLPNSTLSTPICFQ